MRPSLNNLDAATRLMDDYAIATAQQHGANPAETWAIARHLNEPATPPSWATHQLVAIYEVDDCDTQTDYFNTKKLQRVVIGYSRHGRKLFSEMRQAARTFGPTMALANAPKSAEHRENWSMGAGYYLKLGNRYDSGWKICKEQV